MLSDQHAHPDFPNDRADWLSRLIIDVKPDVVINIGDAADMSSLATYEKGKRSFHGKSYAADISSHLEFQSRLWDPVRARKRRLPRRIVLEGNHEHRIERALDLSPELEGTIGFKDYDFDSYYDDVVRYDGGTPGVIDVDGILYAHYFISGVMGRPVGGKHPAYSLVSRTHRSATSGHLHLADQYIDSDGTGRKVIGAFCGVYQDYDAPWAGTSNRLWWRGVLLKHNVSDGCYDPEWISLESLKKAYGT